MEINVPALCEEDSSVDITGLQGAYYRVRVFATSNLDTGYQTYAGTNSIGKPAGLPFIAEDGTDP